MTIKSLQRELKKFCSKLIYERDKGICQWCNKKIKSRRGAHSHHWVARSIANKYGWYDLNNLVLLCFKCHIFRLKAEVDDYIAFRNAWLIERDLIYEKLRQMYRPIVKLGLEDYQYLYKKLK